MNYKHILIISAIITVLFFIAKDNKKGDRMKKTFGVLIMSILGVGTGYYMYENKKGDTLEEAVKNISVGEPDF